MLKIYFPLCLNLIFLLVWLFGVAPFFEMVAGLHFYFLVGRNSQELSNQIVSGSRVCLCPLWCRLNLPITVRGLKKWRLRSTIFRYITKVYRKHKCSINHITRHFFKPLLCVRATVRKFLSFLLNSPTVIIFYHHYLFTKCLSFVVNFSTAHKLVRLI